MTPPAAARDRLVAAATAEFARRGPIEPTLDDIRTKAGVSVGSLYHHFDGKEALHAAAWLAALTAYQDGLLAELDRHAAAEDGIKAVVRHHLRWMADHPDEGRLLLAGRPSGPATADLDAQNAAFFARVRGWYATHATYGAVRPLGIALLNAVWLGPAQEYTRHRIGARAPAKDVRELAEAAWRALQAEETTTP